MTLRKIGIFALTALFVLSLSGGAVKALLFGSTCQVSGTIYFYGRLADKGTTLEAYVDEQKVAETKVKDDGKFALTLEDADPEAVVQVKLSGKEAKPTFSPDKDQIKITLSVEQSLDVKLSTWGKMRLRFGSSISSKTVWNGPRSALIFVPQTSSTSGMSTPSSSAARG